MNSEWFTVACIFGIVLVAFSLASLVWSMTGFFHAHAERARQEAESARADAEYTDLQSIVYTRENNIG